MIYTSSLRRAALAARWWKMAGIFSCGCFALALLHLPTGGSGIQVIVDIAAQEKKCLGEELAKQELLVAEFKSLNGQTLSVMIQDPHTQIFAEHEKEKIKTAFTTNEAGPHWACISNEDKVASAEVSVTLLSGPEAKDYSQIAKKEHLEQTVVTLRKVQESLQNYHNNVLYMREREERLRATNDSTAVRVIGFCLFNVILMISVGGWQMFYFKQFFKSKKII